VTHAGDYALMDQGKPKMRAEDSAILKERVKVGKIRPAIDRGYQREQTAEAHRCRRQP